MADLHYLDIAHIGLEGRGATDKADPANVGKGVDELVHLVEEDIPAAPSNNEGPNLVEHQQKLGQ